MRRALLTGSGTTAATKKSRLPDPKALAKPAELAGIRDSPFLLNKEHAWSFAYKHKPAGVLVQSRAGVYVAHHSAAFDQRSELKRRQKDGQLARDLTKA